MSHECLVVMRNALSENGGLQQDGHSVSTSGGLSILISQLPGTVTACSWRWFQLDSITLIECPIHGVCIKEVRITVFASACKPWSHGLMLP
eukprot:scaffold316078_cov22-Tisochrysis_lutea.AAC.1